MLWSAVERLTADESGTTVVVATYNLENYHIRPYGNRPIKPAESRFRVNEILLAIRPDVLALQEMGELEALKTLQADLKRGGLDLPFREHLGGADTNIYMALLSRFPISSSHPHTNESFVLDGRRFHPGRSTINVDICVHSNAHFNLLTTHLKSKRPVAFADEAELREQEARLLRAHVDELLHHDPRAPMIICGDFNDTPDSKPIRLLIGTGRYALEDSRPSERHPGDPAALPDGSHERRITWTHYYAKEDTYSRIDYIFMSRGLRPTWHPEQSYVFASPVWGEASDHRPVVCTFQFASP